MEFNRNNIDLTINKFTLIQISRFIGFDFQIVYKIKLFGFNCKSKRRSLFLLNWSVNKIILLDLFWLKLIRMNVYIGNKLVKI